MAGSGSVLSSGAALSLVSIVVQQPFACGTASLFPIVIRNIVTYNSVRRERRNAHQSKPAKPLRSQTTTKSQSTHRIAMQREP